MVKFWDTKQFDTYTDSMNLDPFVTLRGRIFSFFFSRANAFPLPCPKLADAKLHCTACPT